MDNATRQAMDELLMKLTDASVTMTPAEFAAMEERAQKAARIGELFGETADKIKATLTEMMHMGGIDGLVSKPEINRMLNDLCDVGRRLEEASMAARLTGIKFAAVRTAYHAGQTAKAAE